MVCNRTQAPHGHWGGIASEITLRPACALAWRKEEITLCSNHQFVGVIGLSAAITS
jgi:hypothetical protein